MRLSILFVLSIFFFPTIQADINWLAPQDLLFSDDVQGADVAIDSSGQIIVVGKVSASSNYIIEARNYTPSVGIWTAFTPISPPGDIPFDPVIEMNQSGRALALWAQYDSSASKYRIYASYFDGTNWQNGPDPISQPLNSPTIPKLGFDTDGNAVAIWESIHSGGKSIESATFSGNDQTWTDPVYISTLSAVISHSQIGVDGNGNAFAVWEFDTSPSRIAYSYYSSITKFWSAPQELSGILSSRSDPDLDLNANGEGLISWVTEVSSGQFIFQLVDLELQKLNYSIPLGFAFFIGKDKFAQEIQVAPSGNAVLIWQQPEAGAKNHINAVNYNVNTGVISSPIMLTDNNKTFDAFLNLEGDSAGNAVGVWRRADTLFDVEAIFYDEKTKSWLTPVVISTTTSNAIPVDVRLAMSPSGKAAVTWLEDNVVQFVSGQVISAPNHLKGKRVANRFAFQTEYCHVLRWDPDPSADRFKIYKNGILIAVLPSSQSIFKDHNCAKNASDTYAIVAESRSGIQSPASIIRFH